VFHDQPVDEDVAAADLAQEDERGGVVEEARLRQRLSSVERHCRDKTMRV